MKPYTCLYCGEPTIIPPEDQSAPVDFCDCHCEEDDSRIIREHSTESDEKIHSD